MNKKLGLFVIIAFLGVQILLFLHVAQYGFGKHKHNGHVCQIYLHCEHIKYSTPSAVLILHVPKYFTFTITLPELLFIRLESYGVALPRAPPFFF